MSDTNSAVENGTDRSTDRRLPEARIESALTEDMDADLTAPGMYAVTHAERCYDVVLDVPRCECGDFEHRDVLCKHVVKASLTHLFVSEPNPPVVARVAARLRETGCIHGTRGCAGPTQRGERGLPCEDCIGASPGHWSVASMLINHEYAETDPTYSGATALATDGGADTDTDPDADTGEPVAVTDGGRELSGDHPLNVHCNECGTDYWIDETVTNDCPECGFVAFEVVDNDPDVVTDGGVVAATTGTTDDTPACEHCDAPDPITVPEGHRLAAEFDELCPDCAGMNVCTEEGCEEAFWDRDARAEHIQSAHQSEDDRPEGASACSSCPGDADPERRAVPDPRVDRNRAQLVCPRCSDYLGGGRFN